MKNSITAVLFDWDGVLLDSLDANMKVYNKILRKIGKTPLSRNEFLSLQSPNWYVFYRRLGIPRSNWEKTNQDWSEFYERQKPELYADAKGCLDRLKALGMKVAVVTNGEKSRVRKELESYRLLEYLDLVVFSERIEDLKPSPNMLKRAMDELKIGPSESLYVGDSPEDVVAAKRAGVRSVGIYRGLSSRDRLSNEQPDYLFRSLRHMIRELFQK